MKLLPILLASALAATTWLAPARAVPLPFPDLRVTQVLPSASPTSVFVLVRNFGGGDAAGSYLSLKKDPYNDSQPITTSYQRVPGVAAGGSRWVLISHPVPISVLGECADTVYRIDCFNQVLESLEQNNTLAFFNSSCIG